MMNYQKIIQTIRSECKDYLIQHRIQACILGLSGGIDSATCAALAQPICQELNIPLIGRSIPIQTNTDEEIQRAAFAGKVFCSDFQECDLGEAFELLFPFIQEPQNRTEYERSFKIRQGNIKARLRMILLYDLAAKNKGIVLSTDNLTEYYLGFWTLHGDHADFGMIQNMWKTEVYSLAQYMVEQFQEHHECDKADVLEKTIRAVPTDGLGITQSDCEQFGVASYTEVDSILQQWINKKENCQRLQDNPVVLRYEATHFKRNWPISIPRETLLKVC